MHFVVKAPNLAHMCMIPKKLNLAIVPSQIFPVGAVAAIFKNGRYFTISQKLRGVEPSFSTLYIGFLGVDFRKSIAEYIMPLYPPFWRQFIQNGDHLQSNTSISETKRRRAFNFDSMSRFCWEWISEKVLPNTPCHCIQPFRGVIKKMAAICKVVRLSQKLRDTEPSISTLCLGSGGCGLEEKV